MAQQVISLKKNLNIPNLLTVLRIFLVPIIVAILLVEFEGRAFLALGLFLLASLTDFIDGYLARRKNQITPLGILLDPIADKLLISSSFISLVALSLAPAWAVIILVGREIGVTGLRAIAAGEGMIIPASSLGKTKMLLEVISIILLILSIRYNRLSTAGALFLYLAVVFSLYSAGEYIIKFVKYFNNQGGMKNGKGKN